MKLALLFLMIFTLGFGLGCNNAPPPEIVKVQPTKPIQTAPADVHNHEDDAKTPRITLEEAKKEFDAGNAVFIDTRDVSSYRFSRIKGAIHMPTEAAPARWREIPAGKKIIAYCS